MILSRIIRYSDEDTEITEWKLPNMGITEADEKSAYQNTFDSDFISFNGRIPSSKDIEKIRTDAYQESYEQGYHKGHDKGYREGLDKASEETDAKLKETLQTFETLLHSLSNPLHDLDKQVKQELAGLAVAIAEKMIYADIQHNPDSVVHIVEEAIQALPSYQYKVSLHVNPQDADIIRQYMGDKSDIDYEIIDVPTMKRGGVKIFTESSNVDLSIEHRLAQLSSKFFDAEQDSDSIDEIIV